MRPHNLATILLSVLPLLAAPACKHPTSGDSASRVASDTASATAAAADEGADPTCRPTSADRAGTLPAELESVCSSYLTIAADVVPRVRLVESFVAQHLYDANQTATLAATTRTINDALSAAQQQWLEAMSAPDLAADPKLAELTATLGQAIHAMTEHRRDLILASIAGRHELYRRERAESESINALNADIAAKMRAAAAARRIYGEWHPISPSCRWFGRGISTAGRQRCANSLQHIGTCIAELDKLCRGVR